jgi:hypothetical protein
VERLVGFELEQEGVERFEVVSGRVGMEVEDCGEGEAEEEVVCCAAVQVTRGKGGEAGEVVLGEEERVEPVYAALMSASVLVSTRNGGQK